MRQVVFALAAVMALGRPSGAMTFSDGDFDPANWNFVHIEQNEGGEVTSQVTTDGNPGNALEIELTLEPAVAFSLNMGVWLWHEPYDPSVEGPFSSIRYMEDAIYLAPGTGNGHATGVALRQNDSIFTYRVDFTPNETWTPITGCGIAASDFARFQGTATLDFSASGSPIEVGFYRAISHPSGGGGGGFRTGAIDNWSLTLVPGCAVDGDCEDGDGCTTDTCVDGVCQCALVDCDDQDACTTDLCIDGTCTNEPLACDDGNGCTLDMCTNGFCVFPLSVDLPTVEAEITNALATLDASPCGEEALVKKVRRKVRKKLQKALKKLSRTDDVTKERRLQKLFAKADRLFDKAQLIIARLLERGKISPTCAATLQTLVGQLKYCASGLPRPL
jgi:hypothetical protein